MALPLEQSRLEALLESVGILHASLELDDLLSHLLRSAMGRLMARRGFVALEDRGVFTIAQVRGTSAIVAGERLDAATAAAVGISLLIPIGDVARPVGMLGLGLPVRGTFDPEEEEFTRALVNVGATAIANARAHTETKRVNRLLDRKVEDLNTLLDLGRALATSAVDPEEVARVLGLTVAGHWAVSRFLVAAWKPGHPAVLRQRGAHVPDTELLRAAVPELPAASLVGDLPGGPFKDALVRGGLDVVFSLQAMNAPFGLVALGKRPMGLSFGEAELALTQGLLAQAVAAFENAWAFREALTKKQMEKELSLAAEIQDGLFPAHLPSLPTVEVAATTRPARQVGGDYYDAVPVGESGGRTVIFCVADVTGKGLPASLIMSGMQASLRALATVKGTLAELAIRINDLLFATTPGNKFVTAAFVLVDGLTGECRIVNAGHNEVILLRVDGRVERFTASGMALGLFSGASYDEQSFTLHAGDLLAMYSDGVSEAWNTAQDEFGTERLVDGLTRSRAGSPGEIVAAVLADLDRFVGAEPQHDDITFLLLKSRALVSV